MYLFMEILNFGNLHYQEIIQIIEIEASNIEEENFEIQIKLELKVEKNF